MVDRRVLLQSVAGFAAALFGGVRHRAGARPACGAAPGLVLVDRQLERSRAYAARAYAHGAAVLEFSSDVGQVWMRELQPRLRTGPLVVEGYTSAATLFCVELLARDYGARVTRRDQAPAGVAWILSSNPMHRAVLAPPSSQRSAPYA